MQMKSLFDTECVLHEPKILKNWKIVTAEGAVTTMMYRIGVAKVDFNKNYIHRDKIPADISQVCTLIAVSIYNKDDRLEYQATDYGDGYAQCDHNGCCYSFKLPDEYEDRAINAAITEAKKIKIA